MKKVIVFIFYILSICSSVNIYADSIDQRSVSSIISFNDPWEKFNRSVFRFNTAFDHGILKPVAQCYDNVVPKPAQKLVTNFFKNIGDIRNFINACLQGELYGIGNSFLRFVINSTIGQFGLIDVATALGIERKYQDFGLTLAHWGMPSGNYIVLPFFGSATMRSAVGKVPDYFSDPVYYSKKTGRKVGYSISKMVQVRANLLRKEHLVVGDDYTFIRDAYLQNRYFQITGKAIETDF